MQIKKLFTTFALGLGLTLTLVWFLSGNVLPVARAEGFSVDIFTDENDGSCFDGDCSLRDAIIIANGNGEADTITLGAGTYELSITGTLENDAATGDLDITDDVTIIGLGPDQTTINANGIDRVFDIRFSAGTVVISGVTVFNGNAPGGGGGISHAGSDLLLINTVVVSNAAGGYAGGVLIDNSRATLIGGQVISNTGMRGGGIRVNGSTAVFTQTGDSIIAYNVVSGTGHDGSGGGVFVANSARAAFGGGQIFGNTAAGGNGGGVLALGSVVTLDDVQILSNTASSGGGVCVDSSVLTQTGDSLIAYNVATSGGGMNVRLGARATLMGTRILDNTTTGNGGGISISEGNAALLGVQVARNTTGNYGGGLSISNASVTIDGGQIVSNTAGGRGGGMYVVYDSALTQTGASLIGYNVISDTESNGNGGGIYFDGDRATLEGGQIVGNTAINYGGGMYVGQGDVTLRRGQVLNNEADLVGGIYNSDGTITLVNTTVSGNAATTVCGGLCNNTGTFVLTFTTVANNTATNGVGGIGRAAGAIWLQNSLVAHNIPINCSGALTSTGHNLDIGISCGFSASGDITNTNPLISPLDADGTHPLLNGSPAIDAGLCLPDVTTDQRGVERPQGSACDIGAYEFPGNHQIYLSLVLKSN
jgi:CSLREA domain-containing protein